VDSVTQAFDKFQRIDFLPKAAKALAGLDMPIEIGFGQTNSQPTTVRWMLEKLDARSGEKILDVGSGSGWTSALLSDMVGKKGQIYAVEKVPQLVKTGADNCRKAGVDNVEFFEAGERFGLPDKVPFDRILVSASADELPNELIDQLKVGGRLVIPVGNSVMVIDKTGNRIYSCVEYSGFLFVPLI
jgi:protein-L-isoaspartate(D-aspartate) O-methyltransferase